MVFRGGNARIRGQRPPTFRGAKMMGKKDYQLFAEALSQVDDDNKRIDLAAFIVPILEADNPRFDRAKFWEFIRRRRAGESLKGLRCNPKYLRVATIE